VERYELAARDIACNWVPPDGEAPRGTRENFSCGANLPVTLSIKCGLLS